MLTLGAQRLMFPDRRRMVAAKVDRYASPSSRGEIEALQVRRFNEVWAYCLAEVPFYRTWRDEHDLPCHITSPSDLIAFPGAE